MERKKEIDIDYACWILASVNVGQNSSSNKRIKCYQSFKCLCVYNVPVADIPEEIHLTNRVVEFCSPLFRTSFLNIFQIKSWKSSIFNWESYL